MILAILFSLLAVVMLCILLFNFAVYVVPAFVGLSAGFWALRTGAGAVGAIVVGLAAGVLTLVVGQVAFSSTRSPSLRWSVALLFAIPAAYTAFMIVTQMAAEAGLPDPWRIFFSGIGASIVACVTIARLSHSALQLRQSLRD